MSRLDKQVDLQEQMQAKGLNLVTCGYCGTVNLHETKVEDIECWGCGFTSEPCNFPDYFYRGMPEETTKKRNS